MTFHCGEHLKESNLRSLQSLLHNGTWNGFSNHKQLWLRDPPTVTRPRPDREQSGSPTPLLLVVSSVYHIVVSGNPQEQELYYEGNFDLADKIWSNHYLKVLEKNRHSYFKLNVI